MRIEDYANKIPNSQVKEFKAHDVSRDDSSKVVSLRKSNSKTVNVTSSVNKEMMQNFAEYYFKVGQTYEQTKSYKMAISAYEKANSVSPSLSKGKSVHSARQHAFHK